MSAAPRELRILDGAHAGARVPVCASMTIGCSLDNDVVLGDTGVDSVHVRLVWDEAQDQWQLAAPDSDTAAGQRLLLGEVASVGPVRLTVAAANDPWPSSIAVPEEQAAPPAEQVNESVSASPLPPPPVKRPGFVHLAAWTSLAVVAITSMVAVLLAFWWPEPPAATAAASGASVALQISRVKAVLAMLPVGRGVRVRPGATGQPPVVEGIVLDDATQEAVLVALARLDPVPRILLWSLPQVRSTLRDAGNDVSADIALRVSGPGELVVDGTLADPRSAATLAAALRQVLPLGIVVRCQAPEPQQVAERIVADLRGQGFTLAGHIERGRLVLQGAMPDVDLPRWERWLLALSRRRGGGLPFAIELLRDPPRHVAPPRLPFVISSVVDGPQAYVMLGDGRRLLPGGEVDGVRLIALRTDALVFSRDHQTFTLPR